VQWIIIYSSKLNLALPPEVKQTRHASEKSISALTLNIIESQTHCYHCSNF